MCDAYFVGATGAFKMSVATSNYSRGESGQWHVFGVTFSADKEKSIYNDTDIVQPAALQILIIIKV